MLLWVAFVHGVVLKYNRESEVVMDPVYCHSQLTHVSRSYARTTDGRDNATYPNNGQFFMQTSNPLMQK